MKALEKTHEYQDGFTALPDKLVKARIQARIDRLQDGNPGDVASVGEGVSEFDCTLVAVGASTTPSAMGKSSFCSQV